MIAILSATENDLYALPLPFVIYSWKKIGVDCIVFIPEGENKRLELVKKYCEPLGTKFYTFKCEQNEIATYSQLSRLYASSITDLDENEVLITGDSDLAVFSDFFEKLNDDDIHVVGQDLVEENQYPMCFVSMRVKKWREVMKITKTYQEHLKGLIDNFKCENIRGVYWFYDQTLIKKNLDESGENIIFHSRKNDRHFAKNRADRAYWNDFDINTIIDSHLPRPLLFYENIEKVFELFKIKFPNEDLSWLGNYFFEYLELPHKSMICTNCGLQFEKQNDNVCIKCNLKTLQLL